MDSETETVLHELFMRSEDDNASPLQSVISPSSTSAQSEFSSAATDRLEPRRLSPGEKRRRKPTEVFRDRFEKVEKEHKVEVRKNSQYVTAQVYRRRADTALCHLLCLCGYTSDTNLKQNKECFNVVSTLISSVKARLMKHCELTSQEALTNREIYGPAESGDEGEAEAEDELRFFQESNQESEEKTTKTKKRVRSAVTNQKRQVQHKIQKMTHQARKLNWSLRISLSLICQNIDTTT